jgi:hypothetical protein
LRELPPEFTMGHQFIQATDDCGILHARRPIDKIEHEIEDHFRVPPREHRLKPSEWNAPALRIN